MIHGNASIAHYARSNVLIWMTMAFQGGFLNAVGFLACGRFISHVTGYATLIPIESGLKGSIAFFSLAVAPVAFLLGSIASGFLVDLRLKLERRPHYAVVFGIMSLCIAAVLSHHLADPVGHLADFPAFARSQFDILGVLAFVCGLQNGTITTVSRSVIRTTHLSGITTDLGLGIVRVLYRRRLGPVVADEGRANAMRVGIIGFFTFGSFTGGVLFLRAGFTALGVPVVTCATLSAAMFYFDRSRRTDRESAHGLR